MAIRVIDAGILPHLRSQSIYHGLAYARTEDTPDTIVMATPEHAYVCIGFHQDLHREVDLQFCDEHHLPVLRRETGGGTVYLDGDQLFVQWVMGPSRLPPRMEDRFDLFTQPLVDTYRGLGIDAAFRPVNDVHVGGRKISGTGAARIGSADVMVGNIIFDFDTKRMARILKVPSAAFRDHVLHALREHMSSIRRELGTAPDPDEVTFRYLQNCQRLLGGGFEVGDVTAAELEAIEEVESRFRTEEFLQGPEKPPPDPTRRAVKIHEDVRVLEAASIVDDGVRRVTATVRGGGIEAITLESPGRADPGIQGLQEALRGVVLEEEAVRSAIEAYDDGFSPGDHGAWVDAILDLREPQRT